MLWIGQIDRQSGQNRQRSDSIGRTVLQTVAQKFGFKNSTNVLPSILVGICDSARTHWRLQLTTWTESAFCKVITMLHGRFVHVGKTVTDLQILGCELHQNAFGVRAPSGAAG